MTNETDAAFDLASAAVQAARRAFERSRSAKNRATFAAASAAFDIAIAACHAEHDAGARDEVRALRAARLARVAPRRALAAAQFSLSF